jgi:hypothetical protein
MNIITAELCERPARNQVRKQKAEVGGRERLHFCLQPSDF